MNFNDLSKTQGVMVKEEIEGLKVGYLYDVLEGRASNGEDIEFLRLRAWQDNISDGFIASKELIEALVPYEEDFINEYEADVRKAVTDPVEKAKAVAPLVSELDRMKSLVEEHQKELKEAEERVEKSKRSLEWTSQQVKDIEGFIKEVMEDGVNE